MRGLAFLIVLASASIANAQFEFDTDYRGTTMRMGNMVVHDRMGVRQTWLRTGNVQTYNDTTGTHGMTVYLNSGALHSYHNSYRGWQTNSYTPYYNQPSVMPAFRSPLLPQRSYYSGW